MKRIIFTALLACVVSFGFAQLQHIDKEFFLKNINNFEAHPRDFVYLGDKPCIVDFYATWCGPCKRLSPILEELAEEYKDKIVIYKVDTDQERELAAYADARSIPTLIWCPMSGRPTRTQGLMPKEQLVELIEELLLTEQGNKPNAK